jgi:hypothetical protein
MLNASFGAEIVGYQRVLGVPENTSQRILAREYWNTSQRILGRVPGSIREHQRLGVKIDTWKYQRVPPILTESQSSLYRSLTRSKIHPFC